MDTLVTSETGTRQKVRLVNFNDHIAEGYVYLAPGQRVSDLLNDDRDFLPVESESGDVRVVSKRAIMEIEPMERGADPRGANVVTMVSGSAYDLLGVAPDADDGHVRTVYHDKLASVSAKHIEAMTSNRDLIAAADQLRERYRVAFEAIMHSRQIDAIATAVKTAKA
ncbi:MAG: hypothetical protein AB7P23_08695 [Amphiplicatus sp.]